MKTFFSLLGAVAIGIFPAISDAQNDSLLDSATNDRLLRSSGPSPEVMTGYSSGHNGSRTQVDLQAYERRNQQEAVDKSRGIKDAMRRVADKMPKNYGEKKDAVPTGITDGNWQSNRLARIRGEAPTETRSYQTYDYRAEKPREKRGILESIGDTLNSASNREDQYVEKRRAGLVQDDFDPIGRVGDATGGLRSLAGNLGGTVASVLPNGPGSADQAEQPASREYRPQPLRQHNNPVSIPDMIAKQAPQGPPQRQPQPAQDEAPVQPLDEQTRTASYLGAGSESVNDNRVRKLTDVFGKKERPAPAAAQPAGAGNGIFRQKPMPGYTPPSHQFQPAATQPAATHQSDADVVAGRGFDATPPPPAPVEAGVENPYLDEPQVAANSQGPAPQAEQESVGAPKKFSLGLPSIRIGGGKVNNGEPAAPKEKPAAADGPGIGQRFANSVRGIGASEPSASDAANTAILSSGGSGNYYAVKSGSSEFHGYNDYSVSSSNVVNLKMGSTVELTKAGEQWSAVRLSDGREGIMRTKDLRKARAGEVRSGSAMATTTTRPIPAAPAAPAPAAPRAAPNYNLAPLPTADPAPAIVRNPQSTGVLTRDGARIKGSYYAAPEVTPLPDIQGENGRKVELGQGLLPPAPQRPAPIEEEGD
ncbi:MAG: hypothetical protein ACI8UO_002711 [Verrucomicrobiales bacterium]|jgi:hypothetical protein